MNLQLMFEVLKAKKKEELKMSKNHMHEVAAMLGVELNERFRLSGSVEKFYLTTDGIFYEDFEGKPNCRAASEILEGIICGNVIVQKIWQPKENERFYVPCISNGEASCYIDTWHNYLDGCKKLHDVNMVCQTKEEAQDKALRMLRSISLYGRGYDLY